MNAKLKELGMSRRRLAKEAGVTGATIVDLLGPEDESHPPKSKTSSIGGKVAAVLGLPPPEEFYGNHIDDLQPFRDLKKRNPTAFQELRHRALVIIEALGPPIEGD